MDRFEQLRNYKQPWNTDLMYRKMYLNHRFSRSSIPFHSIPLDFERRWWFRICCRKKDYSIEHSREEARREVHESLRSIWFDTWSWDFRWYRMDIEIAGRFHQRWCNEFEPGLQTVDLGEGEKGSIVTEDSDEDRYRIAARCRLEIRTDSDHRAHPISGRGWRENDSLVLSGSPISLCKHIISVEKKAR